LFEPPVVFGGLALLPPGTSKLLPLLDLPLSMPLELVTMLALEVFLGAISVLLLTTLLFDFGVPIPPGVFLVD